VFFRSILEFRYGKYNMLKNKIIRKSIDNHYKIDKKLMTKIESLNILAKKF
jgi:hypothetical protein